MRIARLLGLAAFAALALLTSVAPGSASAEAGVMCKAKEKKCAEGNRYAVGTKFSAALPKGTETVLESAKWQTRCKEARSPGRRRR